MEQKGRVAFKHLEFIVLKENLSGDAKHVIVENPFWTL